MNLNMYNNITINRSLMKLVGFETAIYWAQLMEILPRVFSKKTYNEEGYFPIHRQYIEEQIGMDLITQYNCDTILANIGVLEFNQDDRNQIRVSPERMNKIIIDEKEENKTKVILASKLDSAMKKINKETAAIYLKKIKEAKKAEEAEKRKVEHDTKTSAAVAIFKDYITKLILDDDNLVQLMQDWVDSVYARGLFLTKQVVQLFINDLYAYTGNNIEARMELAKIAVKTGYRDFKYVQSYFEKNITEIKKLGGISVAAQPQAKSNPADLISY